MRVEIGRGAPEGGGEIEAKAVHVHLLDPVAQRVHHEPKRRRLLQIERVPAPGVVDVVRAVIGQPVVRGVVDAAEAQASARVRCPPRCG